MSGPRETHGRSWHFRIMDMLDQIDAITHNLEGKTKQKFLDDDFAQKAIERYFEILGEAARFVPDNIQNTYDDVDWSRIIGMRHKISHDYLDIDPEVLWDIYEEKFFGLKELLIELLEKEET